MVEADRATRTAPGGVNVVGADIRLLEVEDEAADQDRVQPDKEVDISVRVVGWRKGNMKGLGRTVR